MDARSARLIHAPVNTLEPRIRCRRKNLRFEELLRFDARGGGRDGGGQAAF
jgi:hypothetical protein